MRACRENALRMKAKGFAPGVIAEITGLSIEEIESLENFAAADEIPQN